MWLFLLWINVRWSLFVFMLWGVNLFFNSVSVEKVVFVLCSWMKLLLFV